jgi:carbon-monoxide dehydrogenase medium subunit
MLALDASVVLRSKDGEREVPVRDFFVSVFETNAASNELLTEVRVPQPSGRFGGTYLKMERRVGDFATVAAAVFLSMDGDTIGRAGIGLTAVGLSNLKATAAEEALVGKAPGEDVFAMAGALAAQAATPSSDVRGSEAYKRHVVDVYVRRGLATAAGMAGAA